MIVKSISFRAPFTWIDASVAAIRRDPRTILGAAAMVLLVILVPAVLQQVVLTVVQPAAPNTVLAIMAFFMLVNIVLFPPIIGGFFRLLHAREQGQAARVTDIFALFREPDAARRMIATALIFMVVYAAVFVVLNFAIGDGYLIELVKVVMTTPAGKQPVFPTPPNGIVLWFMLIAFVAVIMMTAYNLAMTQAALTSRSPLAAIGDGFVATLRNLGAFVLFYLAMCVAGFVFLLVVGLVVGLIAVLFGFISPILAIIVVAPIYLGLVVVVYAVLFGFNYFAWRDTLGDDTALVAQQIAA